MKLDLRLLPNTFFEKIQQRTKRGSADIYACINSTFVAIEMKSETNFKPDPLQQYKLDKVVAAGGRAYVACPSNWNKIFHELKTLSQEKK